MNPRLGAAPEPPGPILWFTGLSGAGKSTLAQAVSSSLRAESNRPALILDGDKIRAGLSADLGFSDADRHENVRRVAEVAAFLASEGCAVLVAMIAPFAEARRRAREIAARLHVPFFEIHVATPLALCEARDVKGLYARARAGELRGFTGLDAPYEPPEAPELTIETAERTPADCAAEVLAFLNRP